MKVFNVIYFLIGYPYFWIQSILVSFILAGIQAHLAYKLEKFPWQVSMEDGVNFLNKLNEGDEK